MHQAWKPWSNRTILAGCLSSASMCCKQRCVNRPHSQFPQSVQHRSQIHQTHFFASLHFFSFSSSGFPSRGSSRWEFVHYAQRLTKVQKKTTHCMPKALKPNFPTKFSGQMLRPILLAKHDGSIFWRSFLAKVSGKFFRRNFNLPAQPLPTRFSGKVFWPNYQAQSANENSPSKFASQIVRPIFA